jgi:hypothetical protein
MYIFSLFPAEPPCLMLNEAGRVKETTVVVAAPRSYACQSYCFGELSATEHPAPSNIRAATKLAAAIFIIKKTLSKVLGREFSRGSTQVLQLDAGALCTDSEGANPFIHTGNDNNTLSVNVCQLKI